MARCFTTAGFFVRYQVVGLIYKLNHSGVFGMNVQGATSAGLPPFLIHVIAHTPVGLYSQVIMRM
jgi:hypothetical protein